MQKHEGFIKRFISGLLFPSLEVMGSTRGYISEPGAGVLRARARLAKERAATAARLKNAQPPQMTRQQLRAESHKDGYPHRAWRIWQARMGA